MLHRLLLTWLIIQGPSSNITFTRCITQMIARVGSMVNPWLSTNEKGVGVGYVNITHSPDSIGTHYHSRINGRAEEFDKFAIPSDRLATELIRHYFSNSGSQTLFPFLHQQSFI